MGTLTLISDLGKKLKKIGLFINKNRVSPDSPFYMSRHNNESLSIFLIEIVIFFGVMHDYTAVKTVDQF